MAINDFDLLAPYYDRIAKLIFGNQLLRTQTLFLNEIKREDKVLILGGGTGELLYDIPMCDKIHFVEKSHRMIERAATRRLKIKVDFIAEDFHDFSASGTYDLIICPFFLDCFSEDNLKVILKKIKSVLKPNGHLIVSDFQKTSSNTLTLKLMHAFFHVFSKLDAKHLLNIHDMVIQVGFEVTKEKFLHRNQLFSRLYRNL